MLRGNEGPELKCAGCGVIVFPRCGGYWYLKLARRGRVVFPAAPSSRFGMPEPTEVQAVLCSGCGRRVREAIELQVVACGPAYEEVVR